MNRYQKIISHIFIEHFSIDEPKTEIPFGREALIKAAECLDIALPKNLGDIIYSFRYRNPMPKTILDQQPDGVRMGHRRPR